MTDEFVSDAAVVVGIAAYDPAVGTLATPVRDAEAVASLLASRFGYEVILQCDGAATLAGLRALLQDLPNRVQEGSRLLFYFAGHGVAQDSAELEGPRGYLVPYGATADVTTHLPMSELYDALKGLPCRHLLVVLDCCFSGSFRWAVQRPMSIPDEMLYEERYQHWVRHPARWVLTSAAHNQYAFDTASRRRGEEETSYSPFAAALLDGLAGEADTRPQGGDGIVTLAELYAYVQDRLAPHQAPLIAPLPGQIRGEFVFRDPHRPRRLVSAEQVVHLDESQNPYRGLKPYRTEHADLFFGRGDATSQLLRHVRLHPLTVVVGPSGSGKSSLVQAGLLPALGSHSDERWMVPTPLRVAGDPFTALHGALTATGGPPPPSAAELRADPGAVRAWAAAWVAACPGEHLLVVVDQAEELMTRVPLSGGDKPGALPAASAGFLICLGDLLKAGADRLRVLVVVRSDYEPDLEPSSEKDPLAPLWKAGRFVVPLLSREDLRQVIEGPASRKALYFDDPGMVDRLVDEVVGMPGGLPLLSYALSRLYLAYLRNGRGDRLLTAADLASIGAGGSGSPGGIVRILREEADRAVSELPDPLHCEVLWRVLLRMVNLVGARPTRRQVPLSELDYPRSGENSRVAEVLRRFIDQERLLVSDRATDPVPGDSGGIEPAHDELLVSWPEFARRIDAARERIPIHRRLTETATQWAALPDPPRRGLDLRLLGLVEGIILPVEWLNRAEMKYLTTARDERRSRTRRQWSLVTLAFLLTVGASIFLFVQNQHNIKLRYTATIQSLVNQAGADLDSGRVARGMLLARQAYGYLPESDRTLTGRVDQLLRRIFDDLPPSRAVLRGDDDPWPLAFDPSGELLVANSGGTLIDMTFAQGKIVSSSPLRKVPRQPGKPVKAIAVSSDGRWLAAGFGGDTLCVWRLAGSPLRPSKQVSSCATQPGFGKFSALAFQPGAQIIVAGRKDKDGGTSGNIQVWRLTAGSPREPELRLEHDRKISGALLALAVSSAGDLFVSLESGYLLRGTIDARTAPLRVMQAPEGELFSPLRLDPAEQHLVALAVGSGQILRWPISADEGPVRIERPAKIETFGFDQSGRFLTVEKEGPHRWLSRFDGQMGIAETHLLSLCDDSATALATDTSGDRVAVACDGTLRLWDLRSGQGGWSLGVGRQRLSLSNTAVLAVRPGHPEQLAVGLSSGQVDLYDTSPGQRSKTPLIGPSVETARGSRPPGRFFSLASSCRNFLVWSPDGKVLQVFDQSGGWRTHQVGGKTWSRPRLPGCACAAAGSADGAWLAAVLEVNRKTVLKVFPASGQGKAVELPLRAVHERNCRSALAFHPDRTELLVGIGTDVTRWLLSGSDKWTTWHFAETEGAIFAAAWLKDRQRKVFPVVGGRGSSEGFVDMFDSAGRVRHRWTTLATAVVGLAFDPVDQQLAATRSGGLDIWDLDAPDSLPSVLDLPRSKSESLGFLGPSRIALLGSRSDREKEVSIWELGSDRLARTICDTAPSNLQAGDWIAYVDPNLERYEMACRELGPHPTLLALADSLAWTGHRGKAQRIYQRINRLKEGAVPSPERRAHAKRLARDLLQLRETDRESILKGLRQAAEYSALRETEHLVPLPPKLLDHLCHWGTEYGQTKLSRPVCEELAKRPYIEPAARRPAYAR